MCEITKALLKSPTEMVVRMGGIKELRTADRSRFKIEFERNRQPNCKETFRRVTLWIQNPGHAPNPYLLTVAYMRCADDAWEFNLEPNFGLLGDSNLRDLTVQIRVQEPDHVGPLLGTAVGGGAVTLQLIP
jgi:hypothetical protein